jgi:hypothetical protein
MHAANVASRPANFTLRVRSERTFVGRALRRSTTSQPHVTNRQMFDTTCHVRGPAGVSVDVGAE